MFEFKEFIYFKDDPLRWLYNCTIKLTELWYIKLGISLCLIAQGTAVFLQLIYMTIYPDLLFFITYGPIMFGSIYGVVSLAGALAYSEFIANMHKRMNTIAMSLEMLSKPAKSKFFKLFKIWKICVLLNTILSLCAAILLLPVTGTGSEYEMYFLVFFTRKYCAPIANLLITAYFLTFPGTAYVIVAECYVLSYFILLFLTQLEIFVEHFENVDHDFRAEDWRTLNDNQEYQRIIRERLIFTAKLYIEGRIFINDGAASLTQAVIPFILAGAAYGSSITFYVYTGMTPEAYPRMFFIITCGFTTLTIFMTLGQMVINMSDNIFNRIYSSSWYTWNSSNKKLYLILQNTLINPIRISGTEYITINYAQMLKLLKVVYSTAAIMKMFSDIQRQRISPN